MDGLHDIIINFLDKNFVIDDGNSVLVKNKYDEPVYGFDLSEFVSDTFGISKSEAIETIKSWFKIRGVKHLESYYATFEKNGLIFPIVQQVAARTMALDLVRVEPLQTPNVKLFYYDIKPKSKFKILMDKWWKWIKNLFIK